MGATAHTCHHAEWKSWRRDGAWLKMPSPSHFSHSPPCKSPVSHICLQHLLSTSSLSCPPLFLCPLTPHLCGLVKGLTFYLSFPPSISWPFQAKLDVLSSELLSEGLEFRLGERWGREEWWVGGTPGKKKKKRWNGKRQSGGSRKRRGRD